MDRFADRRFGSFDAAPLEAKTHSDQMVRDGIAPLEHRHFEALLPIQVRWIVDRRGRILHISDDWRRLTGEPEAKRRPSSWVKLIHPEDRRRVVDAALKSADLDWLRLRICQADGSWRSVCTRMMQGSIQGELCWYGVAVDAELCQSDEQDRLRRAISESEAHHHWAVALSPQVPWTAAPDGTIEEVGPRWQTLTGMSPAQALDWGWLAALHRDDIAVTQHAWSKGLADGEPVDLQYRILLTDGSYRWMRSRAAPRLNDNGEVIRWYGTLEDVQDQKFTLLALAQSEERFRLAVQSAQLGIWDYDAASQKRSWSKELRTMLGVASDAEPTDELALALVHPDDRARLLKIMSAVAVGQTPQHFEATLRICRADDGAERCLKSVGWNGIADGSNVSRLVITFQDVTEQLQVESRIRWAATHDPLTGLPNRALWQETLENLTREGIETGTRFGIMMFDVDDLKRANDMLGHDGGDALLKTFAKRIANWAPADAVIGRLGGDEFGLIAPSLSDPLSMATLAEDLKQQLGAPFLYDGRQVECRASIGGSIFPDHGVEAADLLKAADLALYATKAGGRAHLTIFHSQLRAETQQRSSMVNMAREALNHDLILPYYQPKVDLRNGRILGYEALLRWRHPRLGLQLPSSISAAFDTPRIAIALTERMLTRVVCDIRSWLDAGIDVGRIAINASAADFIADDFAERVLGYLSDQGVAPHHLELEVTETVFLGRAGDNVKRALTKLSAHDVRIALDDFGTGYASLTHLKQFPVDVLKIDRSFVSNIEHDRSDTAIVDAIVYLGANMNLDIVAEGIETPTQAALLLEHGCSTGQGFYLGSPRPFEMVSHTKQGRGTIE